MILSKSHLGSVCMATLLLAAAATVAEAGWSRSGGGTGPNGRSWSRSGSCANGACSSHRSYTGPNGGTVSRSGASSCANGTCGSSATWSGPNGNTVTRSGSVTRY